MASGFKWTPNSRRQVTGHVLLLMLRTLSFMFIVAACGCSGPSSDLATFHDGFDSDVQLTEEFTDSLRQLVSRGGTPISPPSLNEPPLAVAPEGTIELDGQTYEFYPGFLRKGDVIWQSDVTVQFFRSMYPLDGAPTANPADFRPTE